MGRNARDVNDRRWRLAHSMILYCLPGKAWALGLSYPGTSSRVYTLRYMESSRRSCQTTVVLFNTETQRLQRFSSRGSPCLLWLYPWTSSLTHGTSSQFSTLRSWRLPDAVRTIKSKLRWQDYPSRSSPCPLRLLYMRDVQTQKKGVNLNEIDS